jgi:hypothetical protein
MRRHHHHDDLFCWIPAYQSRACRIFQSTSFPQDEIVPTPSITNRILAKTSMDVIARDACSPL